MSRNYDLNGRTVAILATNGFEASELNAPLEALRDAGASTVIVSLSQTADTIRGWHDGNWGDELSVDRSVDDVTVDEFDALVLPGGVMSPDRLRMDRGSVELVREFFEQGKPVAAICHGPWLIVEAGAADGRTLTSYPSIRTDLVNAGAAWVDEEVVVDQGLVTSRSPKDLDPFIDKMLEEIQEGVHAGQRA